MEYTEQCSRQLESQFNFSDHDHWDLNQDTGQIVFSKAGRSVLITRFQFVGSVSKSSDTWLWSWANASILPQLSREVEQVREYGERRGFSKLVERKWSAEEADGWQMTAVTNFLLKGKGAYRPPTSRGLTFVVFTSIQKAATT